MGNIKKIVFLRHGESMANVWETFYNNDHTNFLSLAGIMQSLKAGVFLNTIGASFDKVISSEMSRARLTASIVLQTMGEHLKRDEHIIIDPRINERGWEHTPRDFPDSTWEDRESKEVHWERVKNFIDEELTPYIGKEDILVVSHGITMNVLLAELCPDFIDLDYKKHAENAVPYALIYEDGVLINAFGGRLAKNKWHSDMPSEQEVFNTEFWRELESDH